MRAAALLAALLLVGCGGGEDPGATSQGGKSGESPSGGPTGEARLPDAALGSLERENLGLQLAWTIGVVNRDSTEGAGAATVRDVAVEQVSGADRLLLTFDSAGSVPGYQVRGSVEPATECATGDTIRAEGEGVLVVRLQNTSLAEGAATSSGMDGTLRNVRGLHLACQDGDRVEWVLPVTTATFYRVVEASSPPRLAVDVRHPEEDEDGGEGR